jgi:polyisoprenyl-phosphate glycosyltransferase
MRKLISYIFPVYNEGETLDKLYSVFTEEVLNKIADKYDLEVIFINDGSKDNSIDKLVEIQEKDDRFKVINFSRNFGHQWAITAGIDFAQGDAVIIMDSDLQDPPAVSIELINKWEEGFDVVYAQRKTRKDTFFKKFTAAAFYRILDKFANIRIPKDTGDFRLMDKKVVEVMRKFREQNRFMRGLVSYVGFKQTGVQFDRSERYAGKTNYPLKKMLKLAFDGITSFSTVPLQMITQLGFWICALSFLGILYAIVVRVFFPDVTVHGTTLAIICTLFVGGIQVLMLGILGTYIGRIYSEVQDRPLYIISSIYSKRTELREAIPENFA